MNIKIKFCGERYTDIENTGVGKLPRFLVADFGVNTKLNAHSDFFLAVNNIFNREYKEVYNYSQPGRNFTTGFSVKY